jgi:hypothetical protein
MISGLNFTGVFRKVHAYGIGSEVTSGIRFTTAPTHLLRDAALMAFVMPEGVTEMRSYDEPQKLMAA